MQKVFLIIIFLASNVAYSQIAKDNFETTYPEVKEVSIISDKLEMGYRDQYIRTTGAIGRPIKMKYP